MRMRLEDLVVALASHADDGSITDFTSYDGQILTRLALADRIGALHRYPPHYDGRCGRNCGAPTRGRWMCAALRLASGLVTVARALGERGASVFVWTACPL